MRSVALAILLVLGAAVAVHANFNTQAFNGQWGLSDAAVGMPGALVEDFEDTHLVDGLQIQVQSGSGNYGPTNVLPGTYTPSNDPFGTAFVNQNWDGTKVFVNNGINAPTSYAGSNFGSIRMTFPAGTTKVGFSMGQFSNTNMPFSVNGVSQGTIGSFLGVVGSGGRAGYYTITASSGTIQSIDFGAPSGDGYSLDHLTILPNPFGATQAYSTWGASDASMGLGVGTVVEDFEDTTLVPNLFAGVSASTASYSVTSTLPGTYTPSNDPFGAAFVNHNWDGNKVFVNNGINAPTSYAGSNFGDVKFVLPSWATQAGFSLGQMTNVDTIRVRINGKEAGSMASFFGASGSGGRLGYYVLSSPSPIGSLELLHPNGDGYSLDHLAMCCDNGGAPPATPPAYSTRAFASDWAVSDSALVMAGALVENFEDVNLVEGLQIEVESGSGNYGPTNVLPGTYTPTSDPFGPAFVNHNWDGTKVFVNNGINAPTSYAGANFGIVRMTFPTGTTRIGFSLGQMNNAGSIAFKVNGVVVGTVQSFLGLAPSNNRMGYATVQANIGTIESIEFGAASGDGWSLDHLAILQSPPAEFTTQSFSGWGVSDAALGMAGALVEDFEDANLVSGLQIKVESGSGNYGPTSVLPGVFNPANDPFGAAFVNQNWDGTRLFVNNGINAPTSYAGANFGSVTLAFPAGIKKIGFSLGQMTNTASITVKVNGALVGTVENFLGLTPSNSRLGYATVEATTGTIQSIQFGAPGGDGWSLDHLTMLPSGPPTPDPNVCANSCLRGVCVANQIGAVLSLRLTGRTCGANEVWGSGVFTGDSDVACAAVHDGRIAVGATQLVDVKCTGPQTSFASGSANGVATSSFAAYGESFTFDLEGATPPPPPPAPERCWHEPCLANKCAVQSHTGSIIVTGAVDGNVWGSQYFTDDSSVGTAAVHSGLGAAGEAISVTFTCTGGMPSFQGSTAHGVTTQSYAQPWPATFRLEAGPAAPSPPTEPTCVGGCLEHCADGTYIVRVAATTYGYLWGSNPYTSDTTLAAAAVHAGLLTAGSVANVQVTCGPGQASYLGSTANAVTSQSYGPWGKSIALAAAPPAPPTTPCTGSCLQGQCTVPGTVIRISVTGSSTSGPLWGDEVYSDDSDVQGAVVHAGLATAGQSVTVDAVCAGPQSSYGGSAKHGVTSTAYPQPWPFSFVLRAVQ